VATMRNMAWTSGALLLILSLTQFIAAAEPPADRCALLPASVVSKNLKENFNAPEKSEAPRPFANTASGSDCKYETQSKKYSLVFRAYVDPSPSASAELFARLKTWFGRGSTPVNGIGDEAYMDKAHGLHVRKGKVRFFLTGSATDQQLKDLASGVAGQL
jgi:hypothetical protein